MTYDFRIRIASKKPLYGHASPDTAYVIDDYPSGFKARCRKRVWLEFKARQGWRLVEQTSDKWYPGEEPAKDAVLRWNKPKASTYALLGGCMYQDEQDHIEWAQLSGYAKPSQVLEFVKEFRQADFGMIKVFTAKQFAYIKAKMLGRLALTVNDKLIPWSDRELGEARKDLEIWAEVAKAVGINVPADIRDLIDGKIEAQQIDPDAFNAQRKLREEEAAAAQAEEVARTPGALSYKGFIEYLESKADLKGRVLSIRDRAHASTMLYINFFNLPEADVRANRGGGAEAENNRQMYRVEGFDKKDVDKPVAKVKVELTLDMLGRGPDRAKTKLRAKSGPPAKIAEYLAAHISKMVKEIEPRHTHAEKVASYSYGPY